uniref:hypothetical protein n=1 Tax=uncultured Sphingomonas sp. TaxID=158754 RepID=UPI0025D2BBD2|nr:hypothetical protein [uncultured Sphingomonas sp.]
MPGTPAERRRRYEAEVRLLGELAASLRREGWGDERIARELVERRNMLKLEFRRFDSPEVLVLIEARNRAKYGNAVGPDAEGLLRRYGSWAEVIGAACRPSKLS